MTVVSRAFQVLSDADKKAQFDRFGGDPDSRFGGGSQPASSPFSGFARSPGGRGGGPMFEDEISPEELFRQFFGGGMGGGFGGGPFGTLNPSHILSMSNTYGSTGGGMFDTGPGFVFNLGGGPGVRVHQFGGGRPRRRPPGGNQPAQEPPSLTSTLQSLLPLLLLFILPILSSFFGGSSTPSGPSMRFDGPAKPHTLAHVSRDLKVNYWVDPNAVRDFGKGQWRSLDRSAEVRYMGRLSQECENEQMIQSRMMQDAQGFFWTDEEKMREAREMDLRSCRRLAEVQRRGR